MWGQRFYPCMCLQAQMFCDMTTFGGGWMGFATMSPYNNGFTGNTGNINTWFGLSYNYGTYSPYGQIGDYWRDISKMAHVHLMLKTGNGKYWSVVKMSEIVQDTCLHYVTATASSMNMGSTQQNTIVTVCWDPNNILNPSNPFLSFGQGSTPSWSQTVWGENNELDGADRAPFNKANGGSIMLVRGTYRFLSFYACRFTPMPASFV